MLTAEERMELDILKKHGAGIRELARATGRSRNTVRRYLREGEAAAVRKPAPKRVEKLDPFKDYLVGRMKAAAPDRIPTVVLYREICARGYDGGETRLKQFVRGLVPAAAPEPVARFETAPGQQMQADWATVGRGADKLKVFIATLGWSRVAYVEFCDDEKVESLIRCHENALLAFGGVPIEVLYDNMRTVVIERNTYGRGVHRFHAGFLDYAKPASYARQPERYEPMRAKLNRALAFAGLAVDDSGTLISVEQARTLSDAQRRANDLRTDLELRSVHPDVLRFCREELLADNYFHAVLEAAKSVADKLRQRTGLSDDGATLVDRALCGDLPLLAINSLSTESERSEQRGFANLVKGVFGMFRNPTAHAPKINWAVNKADAEEVFTLLSLIHKRIDAAHIPPRA